MRICFISEAHIIHSRRWLKQIAASGHQVDLIASSHSPIDGVRLHRLELYNPNPLTTLRNMFRVAGRVRDLRPDILHLFGLYSLSSLAMLPVVYALPHMIMTPWGTDVVYDFDDPEPWKSKWIKKTLLSRAMCITALSRFMSRQVMPYLRKDTPIEYVPWGADMDFFHPRHRQDHSNTFTIGITKLFRRKYGHVHLLEAVARLVHQLGIRDIAVVMAGKGELERELREKCRALKIDAYVRFAGYTCQDTVLRDLLSRLDVYVMPSVCRSETLGVAAIEASAMGIPVIASRIGGISEVVEHEVTGILAEPGDSAGIAEGLLRLYRDPELRKRMGDAARRQVCSRYDFDACVLRMNQCYQAAHHRSASRHGGGV